MLLTHLFETAEKPTVDPQDLVLEQMNPEDYDDYEDEDLRLRSGDYVRDTQDGEYGEVFRMQGDPEERRVRILDRDGKGWYIEPSRLTRVDPQDPDVQRYFGKHRQRDMDEQGVAEGWSERALAQRTGQPQTPYGVYIDGRQWKEFPTDDQARAVARKLEAKFKADGTNKKVSFSPAESYMKKDVKEDQDTSAVESAIIRRIMVAHTDLLKQFGPDKVMQAAEEVAYNVGDVDEIGTSDVSAYVAQVRQILGATT